VALPVLFCVTRFGNLSRGIAAASRALARRAGHCTLAHGDHAMTRGELLHNCVRAACQMPDAKMKPYACNHSALP
jgi:hypothetical protein